MDSDAIKFLALGPADARLAGMKQGIVAASLGSPPTEFLGTKMGFVILAKAHELFSYPLSGLVTSVTKIKERPDQIKRVIKAGIKGNRYIRQNRDGTVQTMTDWLKINKELAGAAYDAVVKAFSVDGSVPEEGLRLLIEEAKKTLKLTREVGLAEVSDFAPLYDAQKELGTRKSEIVPSPIPVHSDGRGSG